MTNDPYGQYRPQPSQQWPPPQPGRDPRWQPQPGQWQPQPQYPPPPRGPQQPPRKKRSGARWIFGGFCGTAALIIIIAVAAHGGGKSPTASTGATRAAGVTSDPVSSAAAAAGTVTFIVTGSAADVTYGPAGSDLSGSVPLHKTMTIPGSAPTYYSIDAQLQGAGSVSCEILVGGKVISQASANGSYNIASCEIIQDPFSGNWEDANSN